jgi:hypothetical protein
VVSTDKPRRPFMNAEKVLTCIPASNAIAVCVRPSLVTAVRRSEKIDMKFMFAGW